MDAVARRRSFALCAGGALTVALAYAYAPGADREDLVTPLVVARAPATPDAPRAQVVAQGVAAAWPLREPVAAESVRNPFEPTSFAPPPAPPPPPAPVALPPPPPPPKAPPLPFSFVGLLEQGVAKPQAFLARGDALHVVGAGDVIEQTYRVESVSPTSIVLVYLPLSERQVLTVSGSTQ